MQKMFDYITKLVLFDLLLILSIDAVEYSHVKRSEFICPKFDVESTGGCRGDNDCRYTDPDNCKGFIECNINEVGCVSPVRKTCAVPCFEWNDNDKECVCPEQSTCPKAPATPTYACVVPGFGNTTCNDPVCYYPINYPDCNKYYKCTTDKFNHANVSLLPCNTGMEWNDFIKSCVLAPSPSCIGRPATTTPPPITCPPTPAPPIPCTSLNCVCPTGWTKSTSDNVCLKFVGPIPLSNPNALRACSQYKAGLVCPKTQDKQNFIVQFLKDNNLIGTTAAAAPSAHIWMCARRISNSISNTGTGFVWSDGTPLVYNNWSGTGNEPNSGADLCAFMIGSVNSDLGWFDHGCSEISFNNIPIYAVCERDCCCDCSNFNQTVTVT